MPPGALARKISARNSQLLFGRIVSSGDWDAATAVPPATAQDGQFWKATSAGVYGGATIPVGALCLFSENLTVVHYLVQEAGAGGGGDWGGDWDMSVTSGVPMFPLDMPELGVIDYFQANESVTVTSRADLSVGGHTATVTLAEGAAGVRAAVSTKTSNGSVGKKVLGFRFTFPALSSSPSEIVSVSVMFDAPTSQVVGPIGFQWNPTTGLWTAPMLGGMVIPNGSIFGFVIDAVAGTFTVALDNTVIASGPSAYPDGLVAYVTIATENIHASSVGKVVGAEFVVDPSEFSGFTWAAGAGAVASPPVVLPAGAAEGKEYRVFPAGGEFNGVTAEAGDVLKFVNGVTDVVKMPATSGSDGWSAVMAVEDYSGMTLLKIVDWTGGAGVKPAINTYLGPMGPTLDPYSATNLKGVQGPQGETGLAGADGADGAGITGYWAVPDLMASYPIGPVTGVSPYFGATTWATGAGVGSRDISWTGGFSDSLAISHPAPRGAGAVVMQDKTIWYELYFPMQAMSCNLRIGINKYDEYGEGTAVANLTTSESVNPSSASRVLTVGIKPGGEMVLKRDGVTAITEYGGPAFGELFSPYFLISGASGATVVATLRVPLEEMEYEEAGGQPLLIKTVGSSLPGDAVPGAVYEVIVGGTYGGAEFAQGDMAVVGLGPNSIAKIGKAKLPGTRFIYPHNSWSIISGSAGSVKKIGSEVFVNFSATSGTDLKMFQLPAGCYPSFTIKKMAVIHNSSNVPIHGHLTVASNGEISLVIPEALSNHKVYANFSFVIW